LFCLIIIVAHSVCWRCKVYPTPIMVARSYTDLFDFTPNSPFSLSGFISPFHSSLFSPSLPLFSFCLICLSEFSYVDFLNRSVHAQHPSSTPHSVIAVLKWGGDGDMSEQAKSQIRVEHLILKKKKTSVHLQFPEVSYQLYVEVNWEM